MLHDNQSREVEIVGVMKDFTSALSIAQLLSTDFLRLVGIAFVIATPIAWWAMNKWLEIFAYRIAITWWMFAPAALLVIFITLSTVSFQAIKAAISNPVKSLRAE